MIVEMVPLEIIGLKTDLHRILRVLRALGCMQIEPLDEIDGVSARPLTLDREILSMQEEVSFQLARVEGLIQGLGCGSFIRSASPPEDFLAQARVCLDTLSPEVQSLIAQREKLSSELASLPRYEATLLKLLPILPPSIYEPGNITIGVLVSRVHMGVLESIGKQVLELTAGRADVVSGDVDSLTRVMLIIFPAESSAEVEALLTREDVSRLRLPAELGEGPPDLVLTTLRRRMVEIPEKIHAIEGELADISKEWGSRLVTIRDALRDESETNSILNRFGETDMTFVLIGWVPAKSVSQVKTGLLEIVGEKALVRPLPITGELKQRAPIVLQNPPPVRPFASLVGLLSLPRYGYIDPSHLMAFFLPVFFGMILGDIGYGALLLVLTLVLYRKLIKGLLKDVMLVLVVGSGWAIFFGVLYGEFFGTLGEYLGIHPIWIDRTSAEDITSLLGMSLAVGAVHVTLGLILGVWESVLNRSRSHLLERGGMLLGLVSFFILVGVLARVLPAGFMTPAVAGLIVGIVLLGSSLGWLGLIMGPIEFIGLLGNVLSYLRIAAVALASVYLAKIANEMAGMVGNLIVGVIIAVLIHSLNLVLGAFSPTIHSLRLHYVEFFRKFYEGGGRPYEPFQSSLRPPTQT